MALLDRCESCGDVVERNRLVRMRRKYLQPAGSNLFTYSYYNASGWTATVAASAYESMGCHPDDRWIKYSDAAPAVSSVHSPVSVWDSTSLVDCILYSADVVHAADFYYRFSVTIGRFERDDVGDATSQPLLVSLGIYAGAVFTSVHDEYLTTGFKRFWHCNTSKTSAATISWAFKITGYNDGAVGTDHTYWWFEDAQLETSTTTPFVGPGKVFIPTAGAAKTYTVDTVLQTVAKVCHECRERVVEDYELRGIPRVEPDEAIPFEGA